MTTEQPQPKTFKLPPETRIYHRNKERENQAKLGHPWICTQCGKQPEPNEPLYKNMETKEKLCTPCVISEIIKKQKEKEDKNREN